jgi:alkylated DNA nucleotide flippase Atl1
VVASSGHLNGYAKGLTAKVRLLQREGVAVRQNRVDLTQCHWPLT